MTLTWQLAGFDELSAVRQPLNESYRITKVDSPTEFLASQVDRQNVGRSLRQEYLIKNLLSAPLHLRIGSRTCGCIGLLRDGTAIQDGQRWIVAPKGSCVVASISSLPLDGQSHSRGFSVFVATNHDPDRWVEHRLAARVAVHRDLLVKPSRVEVPADFKKDFAVKLFVEAAFTTRPTRRGSPVIVELSDSLSSSFAAKAIEHGDAKEIAPGILRQGFDVSITALTDSESLPHVSEIDGFVQIAISQDESNADDLRMIRVPIDISSGRRIESAPRIDFGTLSMGQSTVKMFVVRAKDRSDITIASCVSHGSGFVRVHKIDRVSPKYSLVFLKCDAESQGSVVGTVSISTTDPTFPAIEIPYSGEVNAP